MESNFYNVTNRADRIFNLLRRRNTIIEPYHFLISACEEATGVCGELHLYLYQHLGNNFLEQIEAACKTESEEYIEFHGLKIGSALENVLKRANEKKENYGQALINEGHILFAVLELDTSLRDTFSKKMLKEVFQIACVPRDMTVYLGSYTHKELSTQNKIRRVTDSDLPYLKEYIRSQFGERWLEHINDSPERGELPIFIAEQNDSIIGFACYDLVRNEKGVFGPMGTSKDKRFQFVGRELLDTCLVEMANLHYPYAIIDQAGPVEFYEKACEAKLIPLKINKNE